MQDVSTELLERSILGTMMQENHLILDTDIKPEMFLSQRNRAIFQAMKQLALANKPVDYITLLTEVEIGDAGASDLTTMTSCANFEKFEQYTELFKETWRERQKISILYEAQIDNWPIEKIQTTLEQLFTNASNKETSIDDDLVAIAERPFYPEDTSNVIPVDIKELERLITGFREGEVTIIAGRPSMGKTDVMNHFALYAGLNGYLPIIFSLEMNRKMLIDRLIALVGNISRLKMRDPYQYFSQKQKDEWMDILSGLKKANIHIDDRAGLTVSQMRAQIRKLIKNIQRKSRLFSSTTCKLLLVKSIDKIKT